jgi:hypothetical protein
MKTQIWPDLFTVGNGPLADALIAREVVPGRAVLSTIPDAAAQPPSAKGPTRGPSASADAEDLGLG